MRLTVVVECVLYMWGMGLVLLGVILLRRRRTERQAEEPERGGAGRSEGH